MNTSTRPVASAAIGPANAREVDRPSGVANARAATAQFHDVHQAVQVGYVSTDLCVAGMGHHYVNAGLFAPEVHPAQPKALLYADKPDGELQLIGVEYMELKPGAEPADDSSQVDANGPQLFGQHLNRPMAGHDPTMPAHWDLHVRIWSHNRQDLLAESNPAVGC